MIHTGDIMGSGYNMYEVNNFCNWLKESVKPKYKNIVVIAGNHDRVFECSIKAPTLESMLKNVGAIYLNDSGIRINEFNIWGSPVQPAFCNWAFNKARNKENQNNLSNYHEYKRPLIKQHWDKIPNDIDILLTHGPPYGILDQCRNGTIVGCELLLERVKEINPMLHVFGHIHEGYGKKRIGDTLFVNASSLDEYYEYRNKPIEVEIFKDIEKGNLWKM